MHREFGFVDPAGHRLPLRGSPLSLKRLITVTGSVGRSDQHEMEWIDISSVQV